IVGSEGKSRGDVTMSEDDMVIQRGVAANPHAIGYLGHAYYQSNRETLKLVSVDNGHGCVAPSTQTVIDATYEPLSRPLFIYVNAAAAARPAPATPDPFGERSEQDLEYLDIPAFLRRQAD
ncbi:MAG TPA: phosphate-binding protein, partial [Plasticicumulans sp.]|nr:phosphate-binding protein [Plasticicumulans sp.]